MPNLPIHSYNNAEEAYTDVLRIYQKNQGLPNCSVDDIEKIPYYIKGNSFDRLIRTAEADLLTVFAVFFGCFSYITWGSDNILRAAEQSTMVFIRDNIYPDYSYERLVDTLNYPLSFLYSELAGKHPTLSFEKLRNASETNVDLVAGKCWKRGCVAHVEALQPFINIAKRDYEQQLQINLLVC